MSENKQKTEQLKLIEDAATPELSAFTAQLYNFRNLLIHEPSLVSREQLEKDLKECMTLVNSLKWIKLAAKAPKAERDSVQRLTQEVLRLAIAYGFYGAPSPERIDEQKRTTTRHLSGFFAVLELASRVLPYRVRVEAFEPSYNDAKQDYLAARRRFKGCLLRKLLALLFGLNVAVLVGQCAWGMCSEKVKRVFVWLFPEILRKFFGF